MSRRRIVKSNLLLMTLYVGGLLVLSLGAQGQMDFLPQSVPQTQSGVADVAAPAAPPFFSQAIGYSNKEFGGVGHANENTLAIADLNGDGRPDIVIAVTCSTGLSGCSNGKGTGMLSVMLNNGDGTFKPAKAYKSGGYFAIAVIAADMNGDGKLDLVVANGCAGAPFGNCPAEGSVGILLGKGDGTFEPVQTSPAGAGPHAMAVADVNKDGKLDVVVADLNGGTISGDGSVAVLLGTGSTVLQPAIIYDSGGAATNSIVAADVNKDGKLDLVVTNFSGAGCESCPGSMAVLLGNGDGTFQNSVVYPLKTPGSALELADLNGDGKLDAIVNAGGGVFSVLLGEAKGVFGSPILNSTAGTYNGLPVVADVNGDHKPDLIVSNLYCGALANSAGCASVLLGNGNGTFQSPALYSAGTTVGWIAVADLNGDSYPDIVFIGQGTQKNGGSAGILTGNGDGTFQSPVMLTTGGFNTAFVGVADLNGDGKPDLIIDNQNIGGPGSTGILLNQMGKSQSTSTSLSSSLNPSTAKQSVTFTATVSSSAGIPPDGESVAFSNGYFVLGVVQLKGGVASFSTASLPAKTDSITANYVGDTKFESSASTVLLQKVNPN
jgi:hypothetical protein